jgi:hypothetical protein
MPENTWPSWYARGAGKGSGALMNQRIGVVVTVRGGLIVHTRLYREPTEALKDVARLRE